VSRRRPRVPGTPSPGRSFRVEVATGGDPVGALARATRALPIRRGEVWTLSIAHDVGCPTLDAGALAMCTCEVVDVRGRRAA
jgi:hypothetical protein